MAYVTEKRGVFYAVIYEGRNPVSGRESRRWHRCEDHAAATQARYRAHRPPFTPAQRRFVADARRVPPRAMAARQGGDARTVDACPQRHLHRALPAPPPRRHPAAAAPDRALRDALPTPGGSPAAAAADHSPRRPSRTSTRSSGRRSTTPSIGVCSSRTPPPEPTRPTRASVHRAADVPARGPRTSSATSSSTPPRTAIRCCSGWLRRPGCAVARSSVCAGTTSTSTPAASRSPRRSRRSATASSSRGSRPAPAAATSPSTPTPWPCSPTGGEPNAPRSPRPGS